MRLLYPNLLIREYGNRSRSANKRGSNTAHIYGHNKGKKTKVGVTKILITIFRHFKNEAQKVEMHSYSHAVVSNTYLTHCLNFYSNFSSGTH